MDPIAIPPVTPGLPSDLLTQRPDIREAEAQLAAANANVESARAAMLPEHQLTGEGGYASAALRTLLRPESAFFNLAGGLMQPLLDGWRLQGQLDLQRGRQDELLQLYRKAVVNGFGDVERALIAVQQSARARAVCSARWCEARAAPSRFPRRGCGRAPSTWSRCSTPSRPCSRPRTPGPGPAGPPAGRCQPVPGARRGLADPPKRRSPAERLNRPPGRMKSP